MPSVDRTSRTCEYRDGCEWREKKAQEAVEKYRERSKSPSAAETAEVWLRGTLRL